MYRSLWDGLGFACIVRRGQPLINLVDGEIGSASGSFVETSRKLGNCLLGSETTYATFTMPLIDWTEPKLSVVVVCHVDKLPNYDADNDEERHYISVNAGTGTAAYPMYMENNSPAPANAGKLLSNYGGAAISTASALALRSQVLGVTSGGRGHEIWVNGVLAASRGTALAYTATGSVVLLNATGLAQGTTYNPVYAVYVSQREFSRSDMRMFALDPFAPLRPARRVVVTVPLSLDEERSAVASGSLVPDATEVEVRAGGETLVLTLTRDTWIPS
jgi:hypothetical protein